MSFEADFFKALEAPLSPVSLRRIFLLLTRFHYSDPNNYGGYKDLLGGLVYTEGKNSELDVELMHVFDPTKLNPWPSIYVGFKPFAFEKKSVDSYAGANEDGSSEYFVTPTKSELVLGHIAPTADMALMMGEASTAFLFGIRSLLMQRLNLLALDPVALTEPVLVEKAPQRALRVDLTCSVSFGYTMTTNIESHRIKKVAADFVPDNS